MAAKVIQSQWKIKQRGRERETSTTTTTAAHTLVAFGVIKARCKLDMQMQSNEATFNDGSSHTAH